MSNKDKREFNRYKLSEEILKSLALSGYEHPTDIQQAAIPVMLEGKSVAVKSPTGSGKTAAFAIPVCEAILWEENLPQALILEPTRELTEQVKDEVFHIGRIKRLKVPALIGGFPIDKQIQTLRQKSHIVTGTPGRVMDHIRRGSLKLDKTNFLIIDEADLMLDMGFIDEVKEILSLIPTGCQICLFSATLKPEIRTLVEAYMPEPVIIMQEAKEQMRDVILQKFFEAEAENKYETFKNILMAENPESSMIFCGTREMVNVLFQKLRRDRIFCGMLHGEMGQKERLKTVSAFRRGMFRFLIATDVAARGIDFEGITHVFNYDFPTGRETYVHRIGRTGRNGKTGTAVSLVSEGDRRMLKAVEEYTGQKCDIQICSDKNAENENEFWKRQRSRVKIQLQKKSPLNQEITRFSIGGGRKSKIRTGDVVATICGIDGIEVLDIGIIDIRDSMTYVEILNKKGDLVLNELPQKTIKGKTRKIKKVRIPGES